MKRVLLLVMLPLLFAVQVEAYDLKIDLSEDGVKWYALYRESEAGFRDESDWLQPWPWKYIRRCLDLNCEAPRSTDGLLSLRHADVVAFLHASKCDGYKWVKDKKDYFPTELYTCNKTGEVVGKVSGPRGDGVVWSAWVRSPSYNGEFVKESGAKKKVEEVIKLQELAESHPEYRGWAK